MAYTERSHLETCNEAISKLNNTETLEMAMLTGVRWCEIQVIDTPTSERHAGHSNSDSDQSNSKNCIAVNISRRYQTRCWYHETYKKTKTKLNYLIFFFKCENVQ